MITIISCLALLGHVCMALPLEKPTENLAQYFDSRIVGGTLAPEGSAPHAVALIIGGRNTLTSFVCGGSIIGEIYVLTAAHCIASFVDWHGNLLNTFHGAVGTQTWNRGGIIVTFTTFNNHPDYNPATLKNDIGLLRLKKLLEFTSLVRPIQIHKGKVDGGASCSVTGWGTDKLWGHVSEHLQILHMQTMNEAQCTQMMADASAGSWPPPPIDYSLEICTFHSYGYGMCHGDSGSALKLTKNGKQIGLVSWGVPCAIGAPDMFVRLEPYIPFMENIIGKPFL